MGAIYVCLSLDFVWRVPVIYVVSSSFPVVGFFFLHFLSLCEKEKSIPYVSLSENWLVF